MALWLHDGTPENGVLVCRWTVLPGLMAEKVGALEVGFYVQNAVGCHVDDFGDCWTVEKNFRGGSWR